VIAIIIKKPMGVKPKTVDPLEANLYYIGTKTPLKMET
jgi:hypothetical protein